MSLVDFTNCKAIHTSLRGSFYKTRIIYNNEHYILKFGRSNIENPCHPSWGSYQHTPLAEHLGCEIINSIGLDVQNTIYGIYYDKNYKKYREVVACKDFVVTSGNYHILMHYSDIRDKQISFDSRYPVLSDILHTFEHNPLFEGVRDLVKKHYWDMFIADSIIGNFDRHTGNWGYICKTEHGTYIPSEFYCPRLGGAKPPALAGGFSLVVVRSWVWKPTSTAHTAFFRSTCTSYG